MISPDCTKIESEPRTHAYSQEGRQIVRLRHAGNGSPYGSVEEARRTIEALAEADAFASIGGPIAARPRGMPG